MERSRIGSVLCASLLLAGAAAAEPAEEADGMSDEELNKQLNNPVSSVWSLDFQSNITSLRNGGSTLLNEDGERIWGSGNSEWFYNLDFRAAIPLELTESWNLISRPELPFFAERPVQDGDAFQDEGGLGDIRFLSLFSPAQAQAGILWGVGPTFIFPTATKDALGQEKWQAGPSAVALHLGEEWTYGVLGQHWWSIEGADDRPATNQSNVQYFLFRLLPDQWQIGMAPHMTVDWKADEGNEVTFPIGLGVGKLVRLGKLPVKFTFEVDYAVVAPDDIGQRWNLRLQIIPVLPSLVKRQLLTDM